MTAQICVTIFLVSGPVSPSKKNSEKSASNEQHNFIFFMSQATKNIYYSFILHIQICM